MHDDRQSTTSHLAVPEPLVASHLTFFGEGGRTWIDALPQLAAECLDRWALLPDGPPACEAVALVLPVLLVDGTPAVLKLQPVDEETAGEPIALRAWDGHGAVRLLRHDPDAGSMVLERLDADRSLANVDDDMAALQTLSELLARLVARVRSMSCSPSPVPSSCTGTCTMATSWGDSMDRTRARVESSAV